MGDSVGRRAAQKAQTREKILTTARALFLERGFDAVTIVDIAAAAPVSVQTVFNHFTTKEQLFFTDRTPWVEGPAQAVRGRHPGVPPKAALREYLLGYVENYARRASHAEHQGLAAVLTASPDLVSYERGLHEDAVKRLGSALAEAWGFSTDDPADGCRLVLAEVTASLWLTAVRTILLDLRLSPPPPGEDAVRMVVGLTGRVLGDLDRGLSIAPDGVGYPSHSAA